MLVFLREFRALLDAGLPAVQALALTKDRRDSPLLASGLESLLSGIERGLALDEAARARPDVFDDLFQATLRAGVRTSRLSDALERLSAFQSMRAEMRSKVRKALAYPVFLLILLAVVLGILMLFVLPRFAELYSEFGADLPAATRILMRVVVTAPVWIPTVAVAAVLMALLWRWLNAQPNARRAIDGAKLSLPWFGAVILDIQLVQISYMLSMLLQAGAQIRDALLTVSEGVQNTAIRERVDRVAAAVEAGRSLSEASAENRLFPPTALAMIVSGENAGALPELLDFIATLHEQSLDERMQRLLALIEPAMMMLVGMVLGTVIVIVYLPIFGLSGVVQ